MGKDPVRRCSGRLAVRGTEIFPRAVAFGSTCALLGSCFVGRFFLLIPLVSPVAIEVETAQKAHVAPLQLHQLWLTNADIAKHRPIPEYSPRSGNNRYKRDWINAKIMDFKPEYL